MKTVFARRQTMTMHALHEHIAKQLASRVKSRHVVVWYDPRSEFADLIAELRAGSEAGDDVSHRQRAATLIEYGGSMFEIRTRLEAGVAGSEPAKTSRLHPRPEARPAGSVLMEVEEAGDTLRAEAQDRGPRGPPS